MTSSRPTAILARGDAPRARIAVPATGAPAGAAHSRRSRIGVGALAALGLGLVLLGAAASLAFGARAVSPDEILAGITGTSQEIGALAVRERIPRTVIALLVGAALAVSGALLQSLTRNPIADPGVLGVNSGSALAVVIGIAFLGAHRLSDYLLLALLGGLLAALLVHAISTIGPGGSTPLSLALAGVATSAAMSSLVSAIMLPRAQGLEAFRFWQVGSLGRGTWSAIMTIAPLLVLGAFLVLLLARPLDLLALGDEAATGLGVRVGATKAGAGFAAVLLAASVTALAGPISFVGLMVPHALRPFTGARHLPLLGLSALGGAALLLFADVAGRVLIAPSEIPVGVVTAFIGAPILVLVVRRAKAVAR